MSVRVRIAPSPTGNLHIGTARTAVFNWLFARHLGGQFILRIEDTDLERSRPEYTDNILEGLTWLGLTWDEGPFYQSQRLDLYKQAVQTFLDQGLAYRCYCTPEELDDMRAKQKAAGLAPRYDNRHRNLTAEEQAAFEAEGRKPVIRFKIDDDRSIIWKDLVRGTVSWKASDLGGDMVVARAAEAGGVGQPLYNLAVVVDDMDMTITHIIRGEDHIANTAKQILLYEALGGQVPEFAHTPLILNQEGRKLSKRDGVTSISDFRQMGYIAPGLANYMTLLGWTAPDATQEIFTLDEAAQTFTFDRVNQAGAKFDWDKLNWINSQYLHHLPIPELTDLILPVWQEAGFATDSEERSWLEQIVALIGPSLTRLPEAVELAQMFFTEEINFSEEATEQLQKEGVKEILESLLATVEGRSLSEVEGQSETEDTLKDAIKAVTKAKKVKKGLVMRSLRAALTGEVHGPDLIQSWLLWNQKGQDGDRIKQSLKTLR